MDPAISLHIMTAFSLFWLGWIGVLFGIFVANRYVLS